MIIWPFFAFIILVLGARTALWHLRCWQLREYRLDRMRAWLRTKDGAMFWYPWIQPGLLPRPRISSRILLAIALLGIFNLGIMLGGYVWLNAKSLTLLTLLLLLWERTLFIQVAAVVWATGIPTQWKKRQLFRAAAQIVSQDPALIRIGITGSYGKSSTKEVLVHLLKAHFGAENVLYNPANQNNELAIARLILARRDFFVPQKKPRVLVIETGAYKRGEIATVCGMIKPQIGILTGLNQQHLELFGSPQNIADAKFELPSSVSEKVFFNANNDRLVQLFEDRSIQATKIPIDLRAAQTIDPKPERTTFTAYGQDFVLPWPGQFFVENALLALECARELGMKPKDLAQALAALPPLERALNLSAHARGFAILQDTYSANLDGVLQAVAHLKNFPGQRVFVGIPLRELGPEAEEAHRQIFAALEEIKAQVYWCKPDFAELGRSILGTEFTQLKSDFGSFRAHLEKLKNGDVILLESKIPAEITNALKDRQ